MLQSTAEFCLTIQVCTQTIQTSIFEENRSLTVAACYRPPSAPSCALDTICELIAPHLSSELVLLGDLNSDMLNTLQSKLYVLNFTKIINKPTRYNPKSVNTGTLIDILTNLHSK